MCQSVAKGDQSGSWTRIKSPLSPVYGCARRVMSASRTGAGPSIHDGRLGQCKHCSGPPDSLAGEEALGLDRRYWTIQDCQLRGG